MSESISPSTFIEPGVRFRGKPFWAWNGRLDGKELERQISIMKEMGFGGFFMHSRTGLVTEYLGEEWFRLINRSAEAGEKLGLEGWLYDEDRWPSGTAGGVVTEKLEYRMKFLRVSIFEPGAPVPEIPHTFGYWHCRLVDHKDIFEVAKLEKPTSHPRLHAIAIHMVYMSENSFYNGTTYLDTMKREATEAYLQSTHEKYKKYSGHLFGKAIKGVFTDEPHRGAFLTGFGSGGRPEENPLNTVPYTDAIFDVFEKHHGYRVENHLPEIFFRLDAKAVSAVKAHYAETLTRLFVDNFNKPSFEWCDKNHLLLTGHVLHEDSLSAQVSTHGSVQRSYPHFHIPGIDILGSANKCYWVAKQVDSAARQFHQQDILSELYGGSGWDLSFEGHRRLGAWQTLFGVTLRCHHLAWYTMAGAAKRDYPASIFHQSAWYPEYKHVETYFARFGYFRSLGKPWCKLLVVNPVESLWGRLYPGAIRGMAASDPAIVEMEKNYKQVFHTLAGHHYDFDYGDEAILAENTIIGKDEDTGKPAFVVGSMRYTSVLVAGLDTIRTTTLRLLAKFIEAGGDVVFAGEVPGYVDYQNASEAKTLAARARRCDLSETSLVGALSGRGLSQVSVTDVKTNQTAREVFVQHRVGDKGEHYLSLLNVSDETTFYTAIAAEFHSGMIIWSWNAETGLKEIQNSPTLTLSPGQVALLQFQPATQGVPTPDVKAPTIKGTPTTLNQAATYKLAEPNVCVVDTFSWKVNGEAFQSPDEILRIDKMIRERFGLEQRSGTMVQPWFKRMKNGVPEKKADITLSFDFSLSEELANQLNKSEKLLTLAMEYGPNSVVMVNGQNLILKAESGFWIDVAFARYGIPNTVLKTGKNEVSITFPFTEDTDLEALYLLGDFSVGKASHLSHQLGVLPKTLEPKSLVGQGLPYYSGIITLRYALPKDFAGKRLRVFVPGFEAAYVKVKSGGNESMIAWQPYETAIDVGEWLDFEFGLTRRNLFGPLHLVENKPAMVGPPSFQSTGEKFSADPILLPTGLTKPAVISLA